MRPVMVWQAGNQIPGSPMMFGGPDGNRAVQRLKDMYARNVPTPERDCLPQPQGIQQLLQVLTQLSYSMAASASVIAVS